MLIYIERKKERDGNFFYNQNVKYIKNGMRPII